MAKYTKHLLFISLSLSFFSIILIKKGFPEFYPFYSWKLFSLPSGNTSEVLEFRLYGVNGKRVKRIVNKESPLFDGNEKFSIINDYSSEIKESNNSESKIKLLKFAKFIAPDFQYYLVVEERYMPQNLGTKALKISTNVVAVLK